MISRRSLFSMPLALSLARCASDVRDSGHRLDLAQIERLHVQVSFTTPAQPTGIIGIVPAWNIFTKNAQAMLPFHLQNFSLEFDAQQSAGFSTSYSESDLIELSRSLRRLPIDQATGHLHVLFVEGNLNPTEAGSPYALAINEEGLIVVFVDPLGATTGDILLLLQQFSLIHELGHIIGLVNGEVPMLQAHEDPTYEGHCTEHSCVMRAFSAWDPMWTSKIYQGEIPIVLGTQCLADLREHYG